MLKRMIRLKMRINMVKDIRRILQIFDDYTKVHNISYWSILSRLKNKNVRTKVDIEFCKIKKSLNIIEKEIGK